MFLNRCVIQFHVEKDPILIGRLIQHIVFNKERLIRKWILFAPRRIILKYFILVLVDSVEIFFHVHARVGNYRRKLLS